MLKRSLLTLAISVAATLPAFAHLDPAEHGSLAAGFSHPLFGLDHILALIAVGLWAAQQGGRAVWLVPAAFVGTMGIGFAAAIGGLPFPFVEPVVLASVIFIGIAIALSSRLPTPAVAAMVGFFAVFHGHAHGGELGGVGAREFALGFVVATALLHAVGLAIGIVVARASGPVFPRLLGGLAAAGGLYLAVAA